MNSILFVNSSLSGGGSERVMTLLANYLAEHDYNVTMAILSHSENTYTLSENVKSIYMEEKQGFLKMRISRLIQLRKIIRKENPDVVISFMRQINLYTLLASVGFHKKVIVSERADPMQRTKIKRNIENVFYSILAKKIVFQTEYARKCYSKKVQSKGVVIPNPIDTSILPNYKDIVREKAIIGIGRMTEQKNFELLIDAFSEFSKCFPEYSLYIYGEGPLMDVLKAKSQQLNLNEKIFFPGYKKNLPNYIYNSSMYVSTSNYEGISNAMLEAMAMGIPSVCTDCPVGGARLVINNKQNGILIPMKDKNALVDAMKKIAEDLEFAELISKNAKKVSETFSIEEIAKLWNKCIEQ